MGRKNKHINNRASECSICASAFSFTPHNNFSVDADTTKLLASQSDIMDCKILFCKSKRKSHSLCLSCTILWIKYIWENLDKKIHN